MVHGVDWTRCPQAHHRRQERAGLMERLPKLDARLSPSWWEGRVARSVATTDIYRLLAAQKKISAGCACDINRKPLEKAAFTLSEYGVADRVKLILCAGLDGLPAGGADDIVIAGMGGDLIWEIIGKAPWTRDPALRFVLQPMTKSERLRRSLAENGWISCGRRRWCGNFPTRSCRPPIPAGRGRSRPPRCTAERCSTTRRPPRGGTLPRRRG
ncbi:MAG: class I SAM-dependent methyltransferase [Anaerotruncus massiliensis (ex Togo et al. 2019)]